MDDFPTYTPDFEEYIRIKEAGIEYPYKRHYTHASRTTRERMLNYLKCRPYADNEQLSFVLKISISTVRYHLHWLHKNNVICHVGPDKGGHWEIMK